MIWLRSHGQRDPVNEFKTESFGLFQDLLDGLRRDVTRLLMQVQVRAPEQAVPQRRDVPMTETHVNPVTGENQAAAPDLRSKMSAGIGTMKGIARTKGIDANNPDTWGRVPRNGPCPCGSGKKYKHCHGSI